MSEWEDEQQRLRLGRLERLRVMAPEPEAPEPKPKQAADPMRPGHGLSYTFVPGVRALADLPQLVRFYAGLAGEDATQVHPHDIARNYGDRGNSTMGPSRIKE